MEAIRVCRCGCGREVNVGDVIAGEFCRQRLASQRFLVRSRKGWLKDWEDDDRPIFTEFRDDAFDFGGVGGIAKAEHEAKLLGGIVVQW